MKRESVSFVAENISSQETSGMEEDQSESGQGMQRLVQQNAPRNIPKESGRVRKVFNL